MASRVLIIVLLLCAAAAQDFSQDDYPSVEYPSVEDHSVEGEEPSVAEPSAAEPSLFDFDDIKPTPDEIKDFLVSAIQSKVKQQLPAVTSFPTFTELKKDTVSKEKLTTLMRDVLVRNLRTALRQDKIINGPLNLLFLNPAMNYQIDQVVAKTIGMLDPKFFGPAAMFLASADLAPLMHKIKMKKAAAKADRTALKPTRRMGLNFADLGHRGRSATVAPKKSKRHFFGLGGHSKKEAPKPAGMAQKLTKGMAQKLTKRLFGTHQPKQKQAPMKKRLALSFASKASKKEAPTKGEAVAAAEEAVAVAEEAVEDPRDLPPMVFPHNEEVTDEEREEKAWQNHKGLALAAKTAGYRKQGPMPLMPRVFYQDEPVPVEEDTVMPGPHAF